MGVLSFGVVRRSCSPSTKLPLPGTVDLRANSDPLFVAILVYWIWAKQVDLYVRSFFKTPTAKIGVLIYEKSLQVKDTNIREIKCDLNCQKSESPESVPKI